uniref:1-phosphatidylinositol 4-kinase n=1 Tax=Alexandrium catenella TaxID=2925 RepID=A0A7S1S0C5_ALECA
MQRRPSGCSDHDFFRQASPKGGGSSSSSAGSSHATSLRHLAEVAQAHTPEQRAALFKLQPHLPNAYSDLGEPVTGWVASVVNEGTLRGEMRHFILKQRRCDYFNTQNHLILMITKLSTALVATAEKEERKACLASTMHLLNRWLLDRRAFMALNVEGSLSLLGLHIPILRMRDTRQQLLCVHIEHCRVFSSATRAPFLLVYETANLDEEPLDAVPLAVGRGNGPSNGTATPPEEVAEGKRKRVKPIDVLENDAELLPDSLTEPLCDCVLTELADSKAGGDDTQAVSAGSRAPGERKKALQQRLAVVTPEEWLRISAAVPPMPAAVPSKPPRCLRCPHAAAWRDVEDAPAQSPGGSVGSDGAEAEAGMYGVPPECANCPKIKRIELATKTRLRIWGESWRSRRERIRRASPFGRYPSWDLNAVVVKGGDDLRQELLASQVIKQFSAIFKEAGLPLWLYEAEVLVANSSSGFMECFLDTMSVNGIKKHFPGKSLAEIFKVAFADRLFEAKQNFIESYAAYSLVVWFLQVKDRHNDNLLMVSTGHVVHLDFGFMLSNSPGGNIGFESSPFKLTQEFLDVMDGECSDQYEYFRTLVIRGFLEARKHVDRIILPVRMLLTGSKLPCFREGPEAVLQSLHDRFYVNLTEAACIEKIVELIDTSVNNWRTIQYDNYQRIVNGIL